MSEQKQSSPQNTEEEVTLDSLETLDPGSSTAENNEGDDLEDIEE